MLDYEYESGYKEGLELAKKDKQKREVRRLKDLQLPTDIIAIAVDLSIAEVEAILLESS